MFVCTCGHNVTLCSVAQYVEIGEGDWAYLFARIVGADGRDRCMYDMEPRIRAIRRALACLRLITSRAR